jgi:hypothetical protein
MIKIFTKTFYKSGEICTGKVLKTTKPKTFLKHATTSPAAAPNFD